MRPSSVAIDLFTLTGAAHPSNSRFSRSAAICERLGDIDWNFPERSRHSELEALHPYPAKFIAEIPRALLGCVPLLSTLLFSTHSAVVGQLSPNAKARGCRQSG
jgi:hypothetical protein